MYCCISLAPCRLPYGAARPNGRACMRTAVAAHVHGSVNAGATASCCAALQLEQPPRYSTSHARNYSMRTYDATTLIHHVRPGTTSTTNKKETPKARARRRYSTASGVAAPGGRARGNARRELRDKTGRAAARSRSAGLHFACDAGTPKGPPPTTQALGYRAVGVTVVAARRRHYKRRPAAAARPPVCSYA